jgi:predicted RND superfamily exporter protein
MRLDLSGGVPFVYRTQRQLLADLLNSFSSAFAMIALSMAILFRSIIGGLLTMLPNLTPAAIVFGLMGWFGLNVEIGTVLTASVMMGVCVDDTLHLVSHFRQLRRKGLSHDAAVSEALSNCGGAMLQTALVCGLGMLVFSLSPFTPVARFAWLTFTLLMVGVVSDLMLTPAMLLSPLHHLFYWERRPKTQQRETIPTKHVSSHVA